MQETTQRWPLALRDSAAAGLVIVFVLECAWRLGSPPLGANACLQGDCVHGKGVFEVRASLSRLGPRCRPRGARAPLVRASAPPR
jgi:hypothetical protein